MRSITSWKASRRACEILTRAAPDQRPSTATIAVNSTLPMVNTIFIAHGGANIRAICHNIPFLQDLSFRCTALRDSFTRADSELADQRAVAHLECPGDDIANTD
ncbi:uncharacterized protein PHALS_11902 [Plasmopara halstedii]|uniref:Uncharacterized protein n=1 Tax=Plasmopara halstedii TaxID=4781 RepID=A0A0N7L5I4_PLAHL|nr:uncharacterized protein PHALS_11902 [Plasmopara halstedii]CEG41563.1 hypothetical protein PHALS_11902 [Plasmopara halstedii]|eukprot:XP_024577932.1 hypothetical protein PHALS_11902 [Plasmopara halstedii]